MTQALNTESDEKFFITKTCYVAGYKGRPRMSTKVDIMLVERKYSGMSMPSPDDSRVSDSVLQVHFVLNFKILKCLL